MRIIAFLLIMSPCGKMFSIDALLNGSPRTVSCAPWAQRLLQFELITFYGVAVMAKLPGELWMNGTAVYYATHLCGFQRFNVPFLFDHLLPVQILTYGTLAVEAALFTLLWFKPIRYWLLAIAVLLHLGMDLAMNIPIFELLMIACFINFVDPKDARAGVQWVRRCALPRVRQLLEPGKAAVVQALSIPRSALDRLGQNLPRLND